MAMTVLLVLIYLSNGVIIDRPMRSWEKCEARAKALQMQSGGMIKGYCVNRSTNSEDGARALPAGGGRIQ